MECVGLEEVDKREQLQMSRGKGRGEGVPANLVANLVVANFETTHCCGACLS